MTTQIEAMKMMVAAMEADIDAMDDDNYNPRTAQAYDEALAAGRAAIEAAEKVEPVAWMIVYDGQCMGFTPTKETDLQVPVFTNPPSAEIEELRATLKIRNTQLSSIVLELRRRGLGEIADNAARGAAMEKQP